LEVAYALSIGTKIIDLGWPWTAKTLSGALRCRKDACFGAYCTNL